jgi:hypothetical protein
MLEDPQNGKTRPDAKASSTPAPVRQATPPDRSAHKCLVVGLDLLGIIEVVDHDSVGLADPARRHIAQPVHALQPGTVTKVESRHRIGWSPAIGPRPARQAPPRCRCHGRH